MPVRLNITMDEDVHERLKRKLPAKGISRFINDAVRARLRPSRKALDEAYKAGGSRAVAQGRSARRDPRSFVSNDSCTRYGTRVVVLPITSNVDSLYPGEAKIEVKGQRGRAIDLPL